MKVRCINNKGCEGLFSLTKTYDAEEMTGAHIAFYMINGHSVDRSRFERVLIQMKCIEGYGRFLTAGKIYAGTMDNNDQQFNTINDLGNKDTFYLRRFEALPSDELPDTKRGTDILSIDPEEDRLRALFVKPVSDKHTCPKCASPKPCKYHP